MNAGEQNSLVRAKALSFDPERRTDRSPYPTIRGPIRYKIHLPTILPCPTPKIYTDGYNRATDLSLVPFNNRPMPCTPLTRMQYAR